MVTKKKYRNIIGQRAALF